MSEQFISQRIDPITDTISTTRMAAGEPGLPTVFRWGRRRLHIAGVIKTWRTTGPCRHGSGEQYSRRHWFAVVTDQGETLTLYFDRQPRRGQNPKARWWLYSVQPSLAS